MKTEAKNLADALKTTENAAYALLSKMPADDCRRGAIEELLRHVRRNESDCRYNIG